MEEWRNDEMGIREDMMKKMMGNMPKEEKEKIMEQMMEEFLGEMGSEEKRELMGKMMERFMKDFDMGTLMPPVMKGMRGGGMSKPSGGMMNMMRKCMSGEFEPPWVTMQSIMEQVLETCGFVLVHTPELHSLFSEFIHKRQEEVLSQISDRLTLDNLKEKTGLKNESLIYIVLQLARLDEVELMVERKRKSPHNP
jgi:hypothetical protein